MYRTEIKPAPDPNLGIFPLTFFPSESKSPLPSLSKLKDLTIMIEPNQFSITMIQTTINAWLDLVACSRDAVSA